MPRLFVAIRPPRAVRQRLIAMMGGVRGARWQSDDQLHLTLRFIGEVDRHRAADILAALGGVHAPRLELSLTEPGLFDRRGRPEVLWAGVAPHEPLRALHKKIDQALARVGIPPDTRAFSPHITLARLGRDAVAPDSLFGSGLVGGDPFTVDSFALFESEPTPQGAIYTIVERYPLA